MTITGNYDILRNIWMFNKGELQAGIYKRLSISESSWDQLCYRHLKDKNQQDLVPAFTRSTGRELQTKGPPPRKQRKGWELNREEWSGWLEGQLEVPRQSKRRNIPDEAIVCAKAERGVKGQQGWCSTFNAHTDASRTTLTSLPCDTLFHGFHFFWRVHHSQATVWKTLW